MHPLRYKQARFKRINDNGGEATCNVYFPRSRVAGLA